MDVIFVPLLNVLVTVISFYSWIVIIHVIFSWLINFNVINTSNQMVSIIARFLYAATEPVLDKIRRILPSMGGLDLSPIVLILGLMFLSNVLLRLAAKMI